MLKFEKKKKKGVILRSRSRYQDLGEKPSKYFLHLENRNFMNKVMRKLVDEDGSEYYEYKDILNCQRSFYERLYNESDKLNDDSIESVTGQNDMRLSDVEAKKLKGEITLKELAKAFKNMKNGKSPGLDGFTVEFLNFSGLI